MNQNNNCSGYYANLKGNFEASAFESDRELGAKSLFMDAHCEIKR